jgi:hypothetical protein
MSATAHNPVRGALFVVAAAVVLLGTAAPAHASYGWPIKPFHEQHAVRAYFGDPRIAGHDEAGGAFHFGIDISAPDGTPVYATIDGTVTIQAGHGDTVTVSAGGGTVHEYWHVVPSVHTGQHAVAYRTVVGHVQAPWGHVHFAETFGSVYVNPLRPDALTPYSDTTAPSVSRITFEHDGTPEGTRLSGAVDFVAQAQDELPMAPPKPWNDVPVTPALVEWTLTGPGASAAGGGWHVAADFTGAKPKAAFTSVYARWTRQNHGDLHRHRFGRYRFLLAHEFDTRRLRNGTYRLVVRVADTRGNSSIKSRAFTIANGV